MSTSFIGQVMEQIILRKYMLQRENLYWYKINFKNGKISSYTDLVKDAIKEAIERHKKGE